MQQSLLRGRGLAAKHALLMRVARRIQRLPVSLDQLGNAPGPPRVVGHELHQRAGLRRVLVAKGVGLRQRLLHALARLAQPRNLLGSGGHIARNVRVVACASGNGLAHARRLWRSHHQRAADAARVVIQALGHARQRITAALACAPCLGQHRIAHARIARAGQPPVGVHHRRLLGYRQARHEAAHKAARGRAGKVPALIRLQPVHRVHARRIRAGLLRRRHHRHRGRVGLPRKFGAVHGRVAHAHQHGLLHAGHLFGRQSKLGSVRLQKVLVSGRLRALPRIHALDGDAAGVARFHQAVCAHNGRTRGRICTVRQALGLQALRHARNLRFAGRPAALARLQLLRVRRVLAQALIVRSHQLISLGQRPVPRQLRAAFRAKAQSLARLHARPALRQALALGLQLLHLLRQLRARGLLRLILCAIRRGGLRVQRGQALAGRCQLLVQRGHAL